MSHGEGINSSVPASSNERLFVPAEGKGKGQDNVGKIYRPVDCLKETAKSVAQSKWLWIALVVGILAIGVGATGLLASNNVLPSWLNDLHLHDLSAIGNTWSIVTTAVGGALIAGTLAIKLLMKYWNRAETHLDEEIEVEQEEGSDESADDTVNNKPIPIYDSGPLSGWPMANPDWEKPEFFQVRCISNEEVNTFYTHLLLYEKDVRFCYNEEGHFLVTCSQDAGQLLARHIDDRAAGADNEFSQPYHIVKRSTLEASKAEVQATKMLSGIKATEMLSDIQLKRGEELAVEQHYQRANGESNKFLGWAKRK